MLRSRRMPSYYACVQQMPRLAAVVCIVVLVSIRSAFAAPPRGRGLIGPPATATHTPQASATATAEVTPPPTATGQHRIAGTLRYYRGEHPVADATVELTGPQSRETASDDAGTFAFDDVASGTWLLEPRKSGGGGIGVSALDAAYVLQYAAGLRPLNALQRLACDVTANGAPTALDATRILEYAVGLRSEFAAGVACESSWLFVPQPNGGGTAIPPSLGGGVCQPGAIQYEALDGDRLDQNFRAALIGDCTGNWRPEETQSALSGLAPAATAQLSALRPSGRGRLRAALVVRSPAPLQAVEATLAIDPDQLQLIGARPALAASDGLLLANEPTPGTIAIALAMNAPIAPGARAVIIVELAPLTRAALRSRPVLTRVAFDE